MADIFDEVTEDLKKDQYKEFWNNHKIKIISFLSFIILLFLAYKFTLYYLEQKKIKISNQFYEAITKIDISNSNEAENIFLNISDSSNSGYSLLALFKLADISFEKKDYSLMENYYDKIIKSDNINNFYKDYALILKLKNSPNLKNSVKLNRLKPILNSPNELQPIAAELEILLLLEDKNLEKARVKTTELINRKDISNSQRNRLNVIKEIYFN